MDQEIDDLLAEYTDPAIEFANPQTHLVGAKAKGKLGRATIHVVCSALAILGGGIWYFAGQVGMLPGLALILLGGGLSAFAEWRWQNAKWCPGCGAFLGHAGQEPTGWFCPACFWLCEPNKLLQDVGLPLDLSKVAVTKRDPISACFAMLLLMAIAQKHRQLRFMPKKEEFQLLIEVDEGTFELVPPPLFVQGAIAQVATLFAGLELSRMSEKQIGTLKLIVPESLAPAHGSTLRTESEETPRVRTAKITVQPVKHGHEVLIDWLDSHERVENLNSCNVPSAPVA